MLCAGMLSAQSWLQHADMSSDLKELKQTILDTHQNPFTYCTEDEFNAVFDTAFAQLNDSLPLIDFARITASCLNVVKDSHCYLNYSSLMMEHRRFGGRFLSLKVRWIDSTLYCVEDREGLIPVGAELIEYNGHALDSLFEEVKLFAMQEGDSEVGKIRITEAIFPQICPMLALTKAENQLLVRFPLRDKSDLITYPGRTAKYMRKNAPKRKNDHWESLSIDAESDVAVLRIGSFNWKSTSHYHRFLKKSFRTIEREDVQTLVIDIRDNTGGKADRAEIIYSYLNGSPINMPEYIIAKQSEISRERNHKIYRGLTRFIINNFYKKNEEVQHFRTMINMKDAEVDTFFYKDPEPPSNKYRFKGDVLLLMNGKSGSASVNFASGFRRLGLGPIVGEPCLGPISGTWGNPGIYRMPNCGLKVFLSTIRFGADGTFDVARESLQPDHHIPYNSKDLARNRDTQLNFIKSELLQSNSRN